MKTTVVLALLLIGTLSQAATTFPECGSEQRNSARYAVTVDTSTMTRNQLLTVLNLMATPGLNSYESPLRNGSELTIFVEADAQLIFNQQLGATAFKDLNWPTGTQLRNIARAAIGPVLDIPSTKIRCDD